MESVTSGAAPECVIAVRLPSYRSLPLSCLEKISLWIDGERVEEGRMELVLEGHVYGLDEFASLPHLWWFILDVGKLRVRLPAPLASEVRLRGELVTVEPYISNGRFHFTSSSERTLTVVESRAGVSRG